MKMEKIIKEKLYLNNRRNENKNKKYGMANVRTDGIIGRLAD